MGRPNLWQGDTAIAHALGGIDGRVYTNSLEAFEESYRLGFRTFEADIMQTNDGRLVLTHDLRNPEITGEEFLNTPISGKYTALSFEDLCLLMKEYPDIWVVTDTKYTNAVSVEREFSSLQQAAASADAEAVLDRLVIQIYNENMYEIVKEIYPFQSYIFTLYQRWRGDIDDFTDICRWCYANNIEVITMYNYLSDEENRAIAGRYGIDVYVHTEDNLSNAKEFLNSGIRGIYTNVISPSELIT